MDGFHGFFDGVFVADQLKLIGHIIQVVDDILTTVGYDRKGTDMNRLFDGERMMDDVWNLMNPFEHSHSPLELSPFS
jgi:hypothetical protein